MHLDFMSKIFLFFLFEFKEIYPTRAIRLENDITKPLDKWISSILAFPIDPIGKDNILVLNRMTDDDGKYHNLKYKSKHLANNNERNMTESVYMFSSPMNSTSTDESAFSSAQVDFKFSSNKVRLFYKQLDFRVRGWLKVKNKDTAEVYFRGFRFYFIMKNTSFNFTAFASSSSSNEANPTKSSQKFSYSKIEGKFPVLEWDNLNKETVQESKFDEEELKAEVNLVFSKCFNSLFLSLNEIFQPLIQPRIELFSKYPDLLNNPENFYYLIPRSPILRFTLKRIVLSGLSNLDSFKIREPNDIFTHTLNIRNIQGSVTLDYGREDEAPLKINFKIEHLFVMKKEQTNCVYVLAKCWQITRDKGNTSLNVRQSEVMMNALESAIASSLSPSTKVGNVCGMETHPEDIEITKTSDWKTIKDSYKEYIPFNDENDDLISEKFPFDVFDQ